MSGAAEEPHETAGQTFDCLARDPYLALCPPFAPVWVQSPGF